MAIWEHIRNSTPYTLYANGCPESTISKLEEGIAVLILRVEILNFEKIVFWPKIYEYSLQDQWPVGNI